MDNLKLRLSLIASALILMAMVLGVFGPYLAQMALGDHLTEWHLALVGFVFVGLCGVVLFNMIERALRPIINLTDHFMRMRVGDLDPRLPVEGPDEMQRLARAFNDTMSDLEVQIRDIAEEKQAAERGRQFLSEQLSASQRFKLMSDSLPFGLVMADSNLDIVYQNATSESGFMQLSDFLPWDTDNTIGQSLAQLFPDPKLAQDVLNNPERMPFETSYEVGPYRLRLLVASILTEEDDYLGPVLMWEVMGLESTKVDDDLPDLDESMLDDMMEEAADFDLDSEPDPVPETSLDITDDEPFPVREAEEESLPEIPTEMMLESESMSQADALAQRLINAENPIQRGTALVGRSIRLLSERLSTVRSMVEALCTEGESLHHSLEETRQRTQSATYLTAERSESLWELVHEMGDIEERTRATTLLIKRLSKTLESNDVICQSMDRLSDAIEHMVVEARLEASRAGEAGKGMKVIVDEIRKLGREAVRVNKNVKKRVGVLQNEVQDVQSILEEDRRETRAGGRVARRAESALERIERDLSDVEERTKLLAEMTSGQSEIGSQIANHLSELTELMTVTQRVAGEQARILSGVLSDAGEQTRTQY